VTLAACSGLSTGDVRRTSQDVADYGLPGLRAAGLARTFKLIQSARTAGGRQRTDSSPWSVPERPSSTENSSNGPADDGPSRKPPKRSSSTGLDNCSLRPLMERSL